MEYKHSLGIRIQDNFKTHEQAEWSAMSVKRILGNEVYTGTLVQRLLGIDTRTSPNEEKVYPLSGLVGCGDCGAMMIKRDVPAGGKVYAYACWTAMVLDFLPYKQPLKPRKEKLGILENILIIQGRRQEN